MVGHLESARYHLDHLETIRAPTVVLHGAEDPLVPVAPAENIAARVPGADVHIVPGLGHCVPIVLAPVFADAVAAAERVE